MKGWLARAVVSTAEHGRARSGIRRWIRWLPGRLVPVDPRFQGPGDPYPRHWRSLPVALDGVTDGPEARTRLRRAVAALPETWRAVLLARDGEHLPAERVAADLGVTVAQQRRLLNRARAAVRDAVVEPPDGGAGQ